MDICLQNIFHQNLVNSLAKNAAFVVRTFLYTDVFLHGRKSQVSKKNYDGNKLINFCWLAISRCLSTTPHLIGGYGGSILLVHESMIILKPAIFDQMAVVSSVTRRLDYSLNFWPFTAMNICPTAWEVY